MITNHARFSCSSPRTHPWIYSMYTCWTNIWLFLWCRFPVLLHCHVQSWQPEGFGAAHRGRQGLWWVGGCHHTGQVPLTHDLSPTWIHSAEDVLRRKTVLRIFVCSTLLWCSINHFKHFYFWIRLKKTWINMYNFNLLGGINITKKCSYKV